MAFLHPSFLWALLALTIPIIIHLFQLRRYKKLLFPNVQFLKDVEQQTRSRSKLQHLLVLFARLLALAFLVFAFAQPYLKQGDKPVIAGQRAVSVYVDDSFSMEAEGPEGRALDVARGAAQEVLQTFGQTDRFQVLTSKLEGKQQRLGAREQALEDVSKIEIGPFERKLSQVIARQREALASADAPVRKSFIFSDLQRGILDTEAWKNDTSSQTVIIPISTNSQANLYIDSAWFSTPVRRLGANEELNVRIRNAGEIDLENIPMRLYLNDSQRAVATFNVPAGGVTDTTMRFTYSSAGFQQARIEIDDHPIVFDNAYHMAYTVANETQVLVVTAGQRKADNALKTIFETDSLHGALLRDYKNLDLGQIPDMDLIVLNQLPEIPSGLGRVLQTFVEAGGSVALFPAAAQDPSTYNGFTAGMRGPLLAKWDTARIRVSSVALQDPFFKPAFEYLQQNVDLPVINGRYALSRTPRSNNVLKLQDNSPFHSITQFGKGQLHVIATPLNEAYGNYMRHAFFVASMLRMAETSRPSGQLSYTIGDDVLIPIINSELDGSSVPHLVNEQGIDVVPELRRAGGKMNIVLHDNDLYAGNYWLTLNTDTLQGIALDHSRKGSGMDKVSPEELREILTTKGLSSFTVLDKQSSDIAASISSLDQGVKLWKWCIALALLFLLIETALLRWMR